MGGVEVKWILSLIGAAASAIGAWELKDRIQNRNRKLDTGLAGGPLQATLVTGGKGCSVRQLATLRRADRHYALSIKAIPPSADCPTIEQTFEQKSDLEKFLAEKTRFRLGDFVRRQDSTGTDRSH